MPEADLRPVFSFCSWLASWSTAILLPPEGQAGLLYLTAHTALQGYWEPTGRGQWGCLFSGHRRGRGLACLHRRMRTEPLILRWGQPHPNPPEPQEPLWPQKLQLCFKQIAHSFSDNSTRWIWKSLTCGNGNGPGPEFRKGLGLKEEGKLVNSARL